MESVKVKLLKEHTDAGVPFKAGEFLFVDTSTANWLESVGVGERVDPAAKATKAPVGVVNVGNQGD